MCLGRYLESGSNTQTAAFTIPISGCGTATTMPQPDLLAGPGKSEETKMGFSNIIIIQMDEEVQEVWDSARKINCEWTNYIKKRVEFQPFEVQMLDFEEVRFEGDSVDCWMDLQVGKYPDSEEIHAAVKIGEQLSMLVYARDDNDMYDMHIKECFAYSSDNYDSGDTVRLQLTDERGCVMKNKLLEGFYLRREADPSTGGTNIVAYGYLAAFKFPDVLDVFTTCEVEICKGGCRDKCPDPGPETEDEEFDKVLAEGLEEETTTEPYREGVELFGQPLSCLDPETARVDPRCRQPKALDQEPDCENSVAEDPRCPVNCDQDPFHARCAADCAQFTGLDPRCPCSALPTHPNCPPDCSVARGRDPRCPCEDEPLHPGCPADCTLYAGLDPRCPCSRLPTHPNCPANCSLYTGQDPRCPCEERPLHQNCAPDCARNAGKDPRCPCSEHPLHENCLDCARFRGRDPRCPCSADPAHPACPPDCAQFAGQDPRCPCNKHPLHPNCPANCVMFTGQDPRCPCSNNPFHLACPPDCALNAGKDPRCPCTKHPLHENCPPDCARFRGRDPRCPATTTTASTTTTTEPFREGVELFGQPGRAPATTTTAATTTTPRRPQTTRRGRQEEQHHQHGAEHGHDHGHAHHGHHGHHGDPRFHAFHSFHYDPGDGRRGRGRGRGKRSIDWDQHHTSGRRANSSGSARLVRHIRVVSPSDLPHFQGGSLDWEAVSSAGGVRGAVCLSSLAFFSGLVTLLGALGLAVSVLTVQWLRQRRRRGAVTSHDDCLKPAAAQPRHPGLYSSSTKTQFVEYKASRGRSEDTGLSSLFYIQ